MGYPTQVLLRNFTSDELLTELARRESFDGTGGVLFWRMRAAWYGLPSDEPVILQHGNLIELDHGTGQVLMEALIDGDWRSQNWIKDPKTAPVTAIHKGEYD